MEGILQLGPQRRACSEVRTPPSLPPTCIQNAMTKDKKPFTYTPGGLDLSEIKSERMARRLMRNAMSQGVPDVVSTQQTTVTTGGTSSVHLMNLPVQVFPTVQLPPNPRALLRTRSIPSDRANSVDRALEYQKFIRQDTLTQNFNGENENLPSNISIEVQDDKKSNASESEENIIQSETVESYIDSEIEHGTRDSIKTENSSRKSSIQENSNAANVSDILSESETGDYSREKSIENSVNDSHSEVNDNISKTASLQSVGDSVDSVSNSASNIDVNETFTIKIAQTKTGNKNEDINSVKSDTSSEKQTSSQTSKAASPDVDEESEDDTKTLSENQLNADGAESLTTTIATCNDSKHTRISQCDNETDNESENEIDNVNLDKFDESNDINNNTEMNNINVDNGIETIKNERKSSTPAERILSTPVRERSPNTRQDLIEHAGDLFDIVEKTIENLNRIQKHFSIPDDKDKDVENCDKQNDSLNQLKTTESQPEIQSEIIVPIIIEKEVITIKPPQNESSILKEEEKEINIESQTRPSQVFINNQEPTPVIECNYEAKPSTEEPLRHSLLLQRLSVERSLGNGESTTFIEEKKITETLEEPRRHSLLLQRISVERTWPSLNDQLPHNDIQTQNQIDKTLNYYHQTQNNTLPPKYGGSRGTSPARWTSSNLNNVYNLPSLDLTSKPYNFMSESLEPFNYNTSISKDVSNKSFTKNDQVIQPPWATENTEHTFIKTPPSAFYKPSVPAIRSVQPPTWSTSKVNPIQNQSNSNYNKEYTTPSFEINNIQNPFEFQSTLNNTPVIQRTPTVYNEYERRYEKAPDYEFKSLQNQPKTMNTHNFTYQKTQNTNFNNNHRTQEPKIIDSNPITNHEPQIQPYQTNKAIDAPIPKPFSVKTEPSKTPYGFSTFTPNYYDDTIEAKEEIEPPWRKELREFKERSSQPMNDNYEDGVITNPPWIQDMKTTKYNTIQNDKNKLPIINAPKPTWSQTLRPKTWRERSLDVDPTRTSEWQAQHTYNKRPISAFIRTHLDAPSNDRSRGLSVDRDRFAQNHNTFHSPVSSQNYDHYSLPWESSPDQSPMFSPTPYQYDSSSTPQSRLSPYGTPAQSPYGYSQAPANSREYATLSYQPRYRPQSKTCPVQSRSFKYLQRITGTEDGDDGTTTINPEIDEPFVPQTPRHAVTRPYKF